MNIQKFYETSFAKAYKTFMVKIITEPYPILKSDEHLVLYQGIGQIEDTCFSWTGIPFHLIKIKSGVPNPRLAWVKHDDLIFI